MAHAHLTSTAISAVHDIRVSSELRISCLALSSVSVRGSLSLGTRNSLRLSTLPPKGRKHSSSLNSRRTHVCMATLQTGWYYSEYGSVDVLQLKDDLPIPEIADDQVLIKVAAAGLNPVDFKRRQGKFQNSDSPLPTVPGYDVAGTVVRVGSSVTSFKAEDEVFSNVSRAALDHPKQSGSLAQFTATEADLVALKPKNLSFLEAAALPLAILTAQEAFDRASFQPGQSVLVLNGAGGVGSLAIQLAKAVYKAGHVATTASKEKAELVTSLGADTVYDYKTTDIANLDEKFDFILDAIGQGDQAVKALKEGGSVAVLTGAAPEPHAFRFVITSSGSNLAKLTPYLESGAVNPVLSPKGPFPFSQVKEAFEYLESGHVSGKIVVGPIE